MNDPLQTMLQLATKANLFPPNSRYHGVDTATWSATAGTVVYLRRRFIPPPEAYATLQEHTVTEGERPDTLAAQALGDPEQFWRLCDANAVLRPDDLTATPGRVVRVTLPPGIPGSPNA